jgi:hypothetical protein
MTIRTTLAIPGPIGGVPAGTLLDLQYWRAALWIAQGLATAANEPQGLQR